MRRRVEGVVLVLTALRRCRAVLPLSLLVAATTLVACGGDGGEGEGQAPELAVNERNGTVEGVGIGSDGASIESVFGEAPPDNISTPVSPVDADTGHRTVPPEGGCGGPGSGRVLRYRGVAFLSFQDEVCEVIITSPEATTRRGLSPGDPLERGEELYPELDCGESDVGSDRPIYEPVCWGEVKRGTHLWIGGDPINNIEMATGPLLPHLRE